MGPFYLGVDIGGTKTEVSLLTHPEDSDFSAHQVAARKRISTERRFGKEAFLRELGALVTEVLRERGVSLREVRALGVGLPGSVHPGLQRMTQGSIPFFKEMDLHPEFRAALDYSGPLLFENDANCFALAEAAFGAGADWARSRGIRSSELCLLGVTLGTGVGGGMVMNGQLLRGRRGGAGEIGHMTLQDFDRACYCGKYGCAEQFLSGPGLELHHQLRTGSPVPESGRSIFRKAAERDPFAVATLDFYRGHLLRFLSNLANLLDPHVVVLGGGISLEDSLYESLEQRLSEGCFLTEDPPAVLKNRLGDAAGAIGAAFLASRLAGNPKETP